MSRVTVVGTWHQASVLGPGLAELGHEVRGVGSDAAALGRLAEGRAPVREPGLEELLRTVLRSGALRYTADFSEALDGAELVFLALDTPVREDDSPDTGPVEQEASRIAAALRNDIVLCVSAQVPVGATERLAAYIAERSGRGVTPAYVPEFLRLGIALETFRSADRFVIGCDDDAAAERVASLFAPLRRPLVRMGLRSAEMTKHASNAFLAASISFANELADVCERAGADVTEVVAAMRLDRRIGREAFLDAGLGFAGGTLGRDVRAVQAIGRDAGVATPLLDAVMNVNERRAAAVVSWLEEMLGGLPGTRIALLGLTYKSGTSTLRQSVGLRIVQRLVSAGAEVRACDPLADFTEAADQPAFALCTGAAEAAAGADGLVLVTPWAELDEADLAVIRGGMRGNVLLDTRNHFDAARAERAGFRYRGVGRSPRPETALAGAGGAA